MSNDGKKVEIHFGLGVGNIIAAIISWSANKSVLWAILHAIFGWFYVIYYLIVKGVS